MLDFGLMFCGILFTLTFGLLVLTGMMFNGKDNKISELLGFLCMIIAGVGIWSYFNFTTPVVKEISFSDYVEVSSSELPQIKQLQDSFMELNPASVLIKLPASINITYKDKQGKVLKEEKISYKDLNPYLLACHKTDAKFCLDLYPVFVKSKFNKSFQAPPEFPLNLREEGEINREPGAINEKIKVKMRIENNEELALDLASYKK